MLVRVPDYLSSRDGEKPLGIYLIYDLQQQPQYIGYSRNMVLAIKASTNARLPREGSSLCRLSAGGRQTGSPRSSALARQQDRWVDVSDS